MAADLFTPADPLEMSNAEVARLTGTHRRIRVQSLMAQSRDILNAAIEEHVWNDGRTVAATVVLFSGGNDSTTLAHLFRREADYFAHANTTIGIGKSLVEHERPVTVGLSRRGPLNQGDAELLGDVADEVAGFLNTTRSLRGLLTSSLRIAVSARSFYRLMAGDVPRNPASDLIHMSGECLCGAFASPGERAEIDQWFPLALEEVRELEALIADRDDIPEHRKTWGWGADPAKKALDGAPSNSGLLCSSCDDRFQAAFDFGGAA